MIIFQNYNVSCLSSQDIKWLCALTTEISHLHAVGFFCFVFVFFFFCCFCCFFFVCFSFLLRDMFGVFCFSFLWMWFLSGREWTRLRTSLTFLFSLTGVLLFLIVKIAFRGNSILCEYLVLTDLASVFIWCCLYGPGFGESISDKNFFH